MTSAPPAGASPPLAPDRTPLRAVEPLVAGFSASGFGPVSELVALLPSPAELPPGAWIAVLGGEPERRGLMGRLFGGPAVARVHLSVRCTALLTAGYVRVCAEGGVAFGQAP